MIQSWQLQDAKNKLSQLVNDANELGPQIITRHGREVAIVLSYAEYQRIVAPHERLSEFFRTSPLAAVDLDLSRDKSEPRDHFAV